jgi:glucosamine-phosphate N-acetyltransferase
MSSSGVTTAGAKSGINQMEKDLSKLSIAQKPQSNTDEHHIDQSHDALLFEASLLSQEVCGSLPEGYVMRPLKASDYDKKYLNLLEELTKVGNPSKEDFVKRFQFLKANNVTFGHVYLTVVIEHLESSRVVASGTLLVERKFIRNLGLVGHIEDIVVSSTERGRSFGKKVIDQLSHLSKATGCYKTILCCEDKNIGFYEKCGYKQKEVEMVQYFNKE